MVILGARWLIKWLWVLLDKFFTNFFVSIYIISILKEFLQVYLHFRQLPSRTGSDGWFHFFLLF